MSADARCQSSVPICRFCKLWAFAAWLALNLVNSAAAQSATGSYYAKGQFSGIQGKDQWYYQQRRIGTSTYTNMATYASGTWTGGNGNWISDHAFYPDNSYDAVRTWVAPYTGTVSIAGRVQMVDIRGSYGIVVSVLQNDSLLWSKTLMVTSNSSNTWLGDYTDTDLGAVSVTAGDSIHFVVNEDGTGNNAHDSVAWAPTITYVGTLLPTNVTYYVSASGSDSNSGADSSHPWLTVAPLNAMHYFGAGVQILFNRGDTFSGGLNISMAGSSGAPDAIGSYGTGANAILTDLAPGDTTTDIIQLGNSTYVTVNDLTLTGTLLAAGSGSYGTSGFVPGNESDGLRIYSTTNTGIRSESMHINSMTFQNSQMGVFVDTDAGGTDGIDDLRVTNSIFENIYQFGLFHLGAGAGGGGSDGQSTNVYVGSNQFSNIKGSPSFPSDAGAVDLFSETGITIEKNLVHDIGGFGDGTGGGSAAVVVQNCRNFKIQYNEIYNTLCTKPFDGTAIDADEDTANGEIAYNLTHDNGGPGIETGSYTGTYPTSKIAIHHNMSYNDARGCFPSSYYGAITLWGFLDSSEVFNNTVYVDKSGIVPGSTPSAIFFTGQSNTHIKVWNNILKTTQGVPMIRANDLYGNHIDSTAQFIANLYDSSGGSLLISNDDTHGSYTNITSLGLWQAEGQEKIGTTPYGVVGVAGLRSLTAPSGYLPSQPVSTFMSFDLTSSSAARGQALSPWPIVTLQPPLTVQTFDFHGNTASIVDIGASSASTAPAVTSEPAPQTVASGSTVVFNVTASGMPAPTYQWQFNGSDISGATGSRLVIPGATSANAGSYAVVATNSAGSATSDAATLAITSTSNPGRLINLSVLTNVQGTLTAGFVIGGSGTSGSENLLIRTTGPALAPAPFNVPNVLSDPTLTVNQQRTSTIVASNSGWGTPSGNAAIINAADSATGAFALSDSTSKDSALLKSLAPSTGGYTVQVKGASGDSGNALTEVYDDTASYTVTTPRLVNLSCLTQVSAGSTLTAGFVIGGSTARTVLVRATGPALALAPFNVGGTMPDPQIKVQALGGSSVLASNAGWGGDSQITSTDAAVGAFALADPSSKDSVVLLTVAPGPYTAQVSSASGAGGFTLVEVYEVP